VRQWAARNAPVSNGNSSANSALLSLMMRLKEKNVNRFWFSGAV
jgi:hypothetical protein